MIGSMKNMVMEMISNTSLFLSLYLAAEKKKIEAKNNYIDECKKKGMKKEEIEQECRYIEEKAKELVDEKVWR